MNVCVCINVCVVLTALIKRPPITCKPIPYSLSIFCGLSTGFYDGFPAASSASVCFSASSFGSTGVVCVRVCVCMCVSV